MGSEQNKTRYWNLGSALVMTLLVAAAAWLCGGFYYDLNDDVLIKDILSGVYTGHPEGHTMQILYPLGWVLSLLYYIPGIPVFGLFLCLCQFGCVFVLSYRTLQCLDGAMKKLLALAVWGMFWVAGCLEHLVFVQYTVTAGMLCTAAVFWLVTSGKEQTVTGFLKENLWALILYWIGFCLRSEMGLLLLPLAGVTGLCKWFSEEHPLKKEQVQRYLGLFGALAAGMLLCLGAEKLAYSSTDWKVFSRYFDARTTIYDYQHDVVENYEENAEIYELLGMSQIRQQLLKNYNFGADDNIDAEFLEELAVQAKQRENGGLFRKDLRTAAWELVWGHFLSRSDMCLNLVMILAGVLLFVAGVFERKRHGMWQTVLFVGCSCGLWMFLLLRGRMPVRLTTPLYLTLTAALFGLLLMRRRFLAVAALGTVVCSVLVMPAGIANVTEQVKERGQINQVNEAVMEYCIEHPEQLFLEDVYSTVAFSEKMGVDRNKPVNYDLLGGWLVKSPLTEEKLQLFGLESMGSAVCGKEPVRILTDAESNLDWLTAFLEEQGIVVKAVQTERIADGAVDVYQIILE